LSAGGGFPHTLAKNAETKNENNRRGQVWSVGSENRRHGLRRSDEENEIAARYYYWRRNGQRPFIYRRAYVNNASVVARFFFYRRAREPSSFFFFLYDDGRIFDETPATTRRTIFCFNNNKSVSSKPRLGAFPSAAVLIIRRTRPLVF